MSRRRIVFAALLCPILYLGFWPTPVDPVAWQAPDAPGLTGPYAPNEALSDIELLSLGGEDGPEDLAVDAAGAVYVGVYSGAILRFAPGSTSPEAWAETGGRPLGLAFDAAGTLYIADAYRGLMKADPDGVVRVVATSADGLDFGFADDVDVGPDGRVYFTDASSKFSARRFGDPYLASTMAILEHGGDGRLLVYDPRKDTVEVLAKGLQFANGVAVSHDGRSILVVETAAYRVVRYALEGPDAGRVTPLISNLPGFPDNITRGEEGRYWVGLVSPRDAALDSISDLPWLRRMVARLPNALRPQARPFAHLVAVDDWGRVLHDLQRTEPQFAYTVTAEEVPPYLYVSSLRGPHLGRLPLHRALAHTPQGSADGSR